MTDLNYVIYDELGGIDEQAFMRTNTQREGMYTAWLRRMDAILSPIFVDIKRYYTYKNIHEYHDKKDSPEGKFYRKPFH